MRQASLKTDPLGDPAPSSHCHTAAPPGPALTQEPTMTTIAAALAALLAYAECGISTSPLGGLTGSGCNGGYPAECACNGGLMD